MASFRGLVLVASKSRTAIGRWILGVTGLVAVGGLAFWGWHAWQGHEKAAEAAKKPPPAIPVTVQTVRKGDFPVYLNGLGTVQPFDTVTVKSRVDGEVIKVAFKQGQIVQQGDLLVQIDPRPYQAALDQVVAKKAQDEANLRNAQLNLERYKSLAKQDFATRQQLDTQEASVDQLAAQVKGDQAAIDSAQTQLDYTNIKSPLTGRAGFRLVDPGNNVHANDTTGIVSIVRLQPISVVFTAPQEAVPDITGALAADTVSVEALSSDGAKTLAKGHLALLNNEVDQANGMIRMKARYDNTDNALWPGLSVLTRLLVRTTKDATIVPQDAIQHGPDGLFAYVVGQDNKVHVQKIKVADQSKSAAVVTEGLSGGEEVVTAGQYRLQDGVLVQAKDAESTPPRSQSPASQAPASSPPSVAQAPASAEKKP
jgi:multidrug efflux system membrane fusion protein